MDILAKARENLDNPATETLVRKAYKALAGREWDE